MRTTVLAVIAASLSCPAAYAQDGISVAGGSLEAHRLWKSGVSAVISGQKKMAESLWQGCLEADPHNQDCRAGLILLGRKELEDSGMKPAPVFKKEEGLKSGSRPRISGRADHRSALKNFQLGTRYYQNGQYREAHDAWTRCLELDPGNAECADGVERLSGKIRARNRRKAPGSADKLYEEGMRHFMSGAKDKAREAWKKCLEADRGHRDCQLGLQRLDR